MTLLSTFLGLYLVVGLIFAGLLALSFYFAEKECPEHSEHRREYDNFMSKLSIVSKNPKLFLILSTILLWPQIITKSGNK
jgi:hypothetical protein